MQATLEPITDWLEEFKALYHEPRVRSAISRHVLQHGGHAESASDLLQDTFILLYQRLEAGQFRHESSLYTYCLGIAKQLWFNHQRRQRTALAFIHVAVSDDAILSERDALRLEVLQHVLETRLDARMRELLTLYSLGLSFREIADHYGEASPEALKQRIYRCLGRLLRLLQTHPDLRVWEGGN